MNSNSDAAGRIVVGLSNMESVLLAVFILVLACGLVSDWKRNRRLSIQLGLPLAWQPEDMTGIGDIGLELRRGGRVLRLRWRATNTTNAPISVYDHCPRFALTICGVKVPRMHTTLGREIRLYPGDGCTCEQEFSFPHGGRNTGIWGHCRRTAGADQWQLKDTLTGRMLTPDYGAIPGEVLRMRRKGHAG